MSDVRQDERGTLDSLVVKTGHVTLKTGTCSEREILSVLAGVFSGKPCEGVVVIFTNEVQGATYSELLSFLSDEERAAHLLELRAFSGDREFHALRETMGQQFSWRSAIDDNTVGFEVDYLDEKQFLDIGEVFPFRQDQDGNCSYGYRTMNGGSYRLPRSKAEKLLVRNYIQYGEDGLAHVADFRIVSILSKGE